MAGMSIDSTTTTEMGGPVRPSLHVPIPSSPLRPEPTTSTSAGSLTTVKAIDDDTGPSSPPAPAPPPIPETDTAPTSPSTTLKRARTRPSDLDLSAAATVGASDSVPTASLAEPLQSPIELDTEKEPVPAPVPAPAPTLLTMRQALQHTLSSQRAQPRSGRPLSVFGVQVCSKAEHWGGA